MEDVIPYLSSEFEIQFLQRTRGLWSKTFGILWKILHSHGDIFHTNYCLQDAYLVDKFKHLDVLHVHGSDIRWTIHSKKWGWIVRHNLKKAKVVLYATPDLKEHATKFREDAIYLPTPVKTDVFTPKQRHNNPLKAVYFKLPYEKLPLGLDIYLKKNNIALDTLERNIPYGKMPETLRKYDIFVDRFSIPSFSKTCLEAMSCGLAVISYKDWPNPLSKIDKLSLEKVKDEGEKNREFVKRTHSVEIVAKKLMKIYRSFGGE